jgi:hypothetical protein
MNKNTVIGLLVLIVVLGGGYYLLNNKGIKDDSTNTPINDGTGAPVTPSTPSAPSVETVKSNSTSNSTASITGLINPNGASTNYWFEYGEGTSIGKKTAEQVLGAGYSATPAPGFINGLSANTVYSYRLSAKNSFGVVNGAVYTLQTNNTPPAKTSPPTTQTNNAVDIERMTATLKGQVNPNGSATSYWFEYGNDKDFGHVTTYQTTNAGSSFMVVSGNITSLSPLTKYYFRLNGQNQFGTVNGATMTFTTDGPAAFSKPTVSSPTSSAVNSSSAMLGGRINANGADTTYWFEYSTDSLLGNLIGSGTTKKTVTGMNTQTIQTKVDGLNSGTKYFYRLVGKSEYGTVYSDSASFTTKK